MLLRMFRVDYVGLWEEIGSSGIIFPLFWMFMQSSMLPPQMSILPFIARRSLYNHDLTNPHYLFYFNLTANTKDEEHVIIKNHKF